MAARFLSKIDIPLLGAVFFLILAGALTLASSGGALFSRQLMWLAPSILALVLLPQANLKAIFKLQMGNLRILYSNPDDASCNLFCCSNNQRRP